MTIRTVITNWVANSRKLRNTDLHLQDITVNEVFKEKSLDLFSFAAPLEHCFTAA